MAGEPVETQAQHFAAREECEPEEAYWKLSDSATRLSDLGGLGMKSVLAGCHTHSLHSKTRYTKP